MIVEVSPTYIVSDEENSESNNNPDVEEQEIHHETALSCMGCEKHYTDLEIRSVCLKCEMSHHVKCLVNDMCLRCTRKKHILENRERAKKKQAQQAMQMLAKSQKRFKMINEDDTVLIPIPDVDRGHLDPANLHAIVLKKGENSTFQLGTRHGIIKSYFSRNQFNSCSEKFLTRSDVPMDKMLSVREANREESKSHGLTGQGFQKCSCTGKCVTVAV